MGSFSPLANTTFRNSFFPSGATSAAATVNPKNSAPQNSRILIGFSDAYTNPRQIQEFHDNLRTQKAAQLRSFDQYSPDANRRQWAPMTSHFLYELWLATARIHSNALAIVDFSADRYWTFTDVLREGERVLTNPSPIQFIDGSGPDFIFKLLRAWRAGSLTCPLEPEQSSPSFDTLPTNCEHLKLTSASSGPPKCIAFTGAELAADAANIVSTMLLNEDAPNIGCISLAHSYGFSNLVLPLLLHGIPLFLIPAPLPELILSTAKKARWVTLPAVPALWKTWHETRSVPHNVHVAISAGAPLPLDLEVAIFQRSALKIHNFYGSSECGGIAYDGTSLPRTENCVGSALNNVRLSLSPTGTLVVESDAVGETYFPEPQPALRSGRFETTDLAEIREGVVYLRGRLTDLLNIAGRKASPDAIEAILRTHPAVVECIVFGISEAAQDRSETVVAAVHAKAPVQISDLTTFLSGKLPAWQIPRRWWFTEELAPNNRGKISRAEWKNRYSQKQ